MLNTPRARRGMVTSPHHLASEAGLRVLREGGNAIEAAVAIAANLAVVYPHMTSIGGDGFWLIAPPGKDPIAIDACGAAALTAEPALYAKAGHKTIPWRGPLAANTVAGTISGWGSALALAQDLGGRMPLARLLEDAAWHGENGFAVTHSQHALTAEKLPELKDAPGFKDQFLSKGKPPAEASLMKLPALARTLKRLGRDGAQDFYTGKIARDLAAGLAEIGAPVTADDLARHRATRPEPLSVAIKGAKLFNFPPPTQGLSSLMILALFERLGVERADGFAYVHGLVEATKQAFLVRDRIIGDPASMTEDPATSLKKSKLDALAERISMRKALAWPAPADKGDTIWLGVIDANGLAVSFIQSIYFEYGSGCVLPETGIVWQNRGASFALSGTGPRVLAPGRKPFHTLNPALARFADGRTMVYGTMGGEGQPQTQAVVFSRYAMFGQGLQAAITGPRWLLGKTWGQESVTLKLESRFDAALVEKLRKAGHDVEMLAGLHQHHGARGRDRAQQGRHPRGRHRSALRRRRNWILTSHVPDLGREGGAFLRPLEPLQQHLQQLAFGVGLAHVVVHAGCKAIDAFFIDGMRRHRDDRHTWQTAHGFALTDLRRGSQAVQFRHFAVHQHEVVGLALALGDRFQAVRGDVHIATKPAQKRARHRDVGRIVFSDQNPGTEPSATAF